MRREILLNAFHMNTVDHQTFGLWRHPRNRTRDYNKLASWIDLARILDAACLTACSWPTCWASTTSTATLPTQR